LLRALSNLVLNVSRNGASTTSLGNPFQCFTTLIVKNFFLISSLNLPCFSLKPLPLHDLRGEDPASSSPAFASHVHSPGHRLSLPALLGHWPVSQPASAY